MADWAVWVGAASLALGKGTFWNRRVAGEAWDTMGGALATITEAHTAGPLGTHQLRAFRRARGTENNNGMQVKQNSNTSQRRAGMSTMDNPKKRAILHLCGHESQLHRRGRFTVCLQVSSWSIGMDLTASSG